MRYARLVLVSIVALSPISGACTFARGYFHQVSALRGRVVGKDLKPLGFRWLRQSFSVKDATMTLYEYRWPARIEDLKRVAVIKTDAHGNFDFGSVPNGHYSLEIEASGSEPMGGWFDVEVTDKVKATKDIKIDVSPIYPSCTGGHEFIETKV